MPERLNLKAIIAETEKEPFQFDGPDGQELELPHASCLTLGQAYRIDKGAVEEVVREVAPDVADLLPDLPGYAIDALIAAWLEHSRTDPGESEASSRSSTSTGRRSTRTSRRTTASRSRTSARRS